MAPPAGPDPAFEAGHFVCPSCEVVATMRWRQMRTTDNQPGPDSRLRRSDCVLCQASAYWVDGELVWPIHRIGAPPSDDLPAGLVGTYSEARDIASRSPRSAAALLRMLVEHLAAELGYATGSLNQRLEAMAADGKVLTPVVEAMHAIRVSGNEAVHEGTLPAVEASDLDTVVLLFDIVNQIVASAITMPKRIAHIKAKTTKPT